jgi:5-methyltetrahydropteroyltriglutamate--homocysteine methyltransferase
MPLLTTTIGAYPKPSYVPVIDWFADDLMTTRIPTESYDRTLESLGDEAESLFARAAKEVIADQVACGIDIPTDGEVRRENYIHYHCRHLTGFDFEMLVPKSLRQGAYTVELPSIVGKIEAREPFLPRDWRAAQQSTDRPVKVTLPGPMTIADTTVDLYYDDELALGRDLAAALNKEILALAEAGCRHIQIDEPLFARYPEKALAFGIDQIERCWHGVPDSVTRTAHMCCGYPNKLDDEDYPKADPGAYLTIAEGIDRSSVQAVSLEDAHRHNDLKLLEIFEHTTVILGLVTIASSHMESVEEIRVRVLRALEHIPAERLMAAPDCGLGYFTREQAMAKLNALCAAAKSV